MKRAKSPPKTVTLPDGLRYVDEAVGKGPLPHTGQTVVVHYVGTLRDGTKFDSSRDRGEPFSFPIGAGRVIPGWDEGVATMRAGGRRKLIVPPALGYGSAGAGDKIRRTRPSSSKSNCSKSTDVRTAGIIAVTAFGSECAYINAVEQPASACGATFLGTGATPARLSPDTERRLPDEI